MNENNNNLKGKIHVELSSTQVQGVLLIGTYVQK